MRKPLKILKVEHGEYDRIETNETRCNVYRRHNPTYYEHLLGASWELYHNPELLEETYQEWIRKQKI